LIPVTPEGGKVARAQAVCAQVESGNIYLPHPALAPWVDDLIEGTFPHGRNDDQVDALTQARQEQPGRQVCAENSVLRSEVLKIFKIAPVVQ
jgi:predicted phage terminase large subunit-like protein